MIKAIIFDLDGTLINTLGGIANACNHVLIKNGFPTNETNDYCDFVGNGLAMTMFRALPKKMQEEIGASNSHMQNQKDMHGETDFENEKLKGYISELIAYYAKNPITETFLYDGIPEVLSYLKKSDIPWGIHTNKTYSIALDVASAFFSSDEYIGLSGPCDTIKKKPDPQGSLALLDKAFPDNNGYKLSEIIYIGDTEVDIETARNLGIKIISVSWGFRKAEHLEVNKPNYLIHEPKEIITLINRLNDETLT
jgi:phosphoglycolate phosphatase